MTHTVRTMVGLAAAALGLLAAAPVRAAVTPEAKELQSRVIERTVSGEVVVVTRRYLSVEFAQTQDASEEMLLPVNEETVYERLKGVMDLNRGDRVKVVYEQTILPAAQSGEEPKIMNTVAKTVTLVKRAAVDALQSRAPATEDE